MADGVTNFYVNGNEYFNVFPLWDWEKIPGISCELNGEPLVCNHVTTLGSTTFVGGVTDGLHGVSAFDFRAPFMGALTAHKSWYFFDDYVVAIGSSIDCPTSNPVVTSVNQYFLNGPVLSSTSTSPLPNGDHKFNTTNLWLHHNNIGYYFPKTQNVELHNAPQTGTWDSIGVGHGSVTSEMFSLWISHTQGPKTSGGWYEYVVVPGVDVNGFKDVMGMYKSGVSTVNQEEVHAVAIEKGSGLEVGVVFWKSGSVTIDKTTIESDQSGVTLILLEAEQVTLSFADPTQLLSKAVIRLTGLSFEGTGCQLIPNGTQINLDPLPVGEMAGSTVSVKCQKK